MDWFLVAQNDWSVYHNTTRLSNFVKKGKITADQYKQITGIDYVG